MFRILVKKKSIKLEMIVFLVIVPAIIARDQMKINVLSVIRMELSICAVRLTVAFLLIVVEMDILQIYKIKIAINVQFNVEPV